MENGVVGLELKMGGMGDEAGLKASASNLA